MAGQRVWFARDAWLTADPKVEALLAEFGAEGVLAFEELLAIAKITNSGGSLTVHPKQLAKRVGTTERRAKAIVFRVNELDLVNLSATENGAFSGQVPRWTRWNDPRSTERKQRQRSRESHEDVTGPDRDNGVTVTEMSRRTETVNRTTSRGLQEEGREDVDRLCSLLASLVRDNGRPDHLISWPSETWRREGRLMLDRDHRDPGEAERLIRWCQTDGFWKGNVLSMPTFRKHYDRLRIKAQADEDPRPKAPDEWVTLPDGEVVDERTYRQLVEMGYEK